MWVEILLKKKMPEASFTIYMGANLYFIIELFILKMDEILALG